MLTERDRQTLRRERSFRSSSEEHDEFIDHINKRANFFRMTSTGCTTVDDKRLRNWSNPPKKVNLKKKGIGFYGGAYRVIEYEHIGAYVQINLIYLEEIEQIDIGATMARIDGNKLIITKFNGSKPSNVVDTFIIKDEQPKPPTIKKRICARCNNEAGDDGMYCSSKCRRKHENKLFGEMKRQPASDKSFINSGSKEKDKLNYVMMVKGMVDEDRR